MEYQDKKTSEPRSYNIVSLTKLVANCEYLGLFAYKREVLKLIAENEDFLKFTNVRRHTIANLNEEEIPIVTYPFIKCYSFMK